MERSREMELRKMKYEGKMVEKLIFIASVYITASDIPLMIKDQTKETLTTFLFVTHPPNFIDPFTIRI